MQADVTRGAAFVSVIVAVGGGLHVADLSLPARGDQNLAVRSAELAATSLPIGIDLGILFLTFFIDTC